MRLLYLALVGALAMVALTVAPLAHAQTLPACPGPSGTQIAPDAAVLTWTPPTTNTDGSAIRPPIGYTVYQVNAGKLCATAQPAALFTGLQPGMYGWQVTTTTPDGESALSNVAVKTIVSGVLMVDPAFLDGYSLLKVPDGIVLPRVGTVTLGTICKGDSVTMNGVTYNLIPGAMVTPYNPNATAIFARCR